VSCREETRRQYCIAEKGKGHKRKQEKKTHLVLLRKRLHLVELVGVTRAHPDVADLSGLDDVVKRRHGLLDRSFLVEAVALEDVDVVESEASEGLVDRVEDVLARETAAVDVALGLYSRWRRVSWGRKKKKTRRISNRGP
jgi:hypothetical protein